MNPSNFTARTWLNVLGVVLLVALVVPFVVYAVPQTAGADESYVVLTGSMTPVIAPGDVVVVTAVDPATIRVGDVVTYQRGPGDLPVTHRVVEVMAGDGGLQFQTQGDANEDPDAAPVPAASVVGVVTLTIPYIGHVITFVNSQYGFVALVVVPLGLLLLTEVADVVLGTRGGRDASDAAAADGATDPVAEPAAPVTPDDPESDTDFTLTRNDLTLTSVGLGAFAVYSGYVALSDLSPLTVTVAVGATTAFLLAIGVRQFGMAPAEATPQTDGGTNAVVDAPRPAGAGEGATPAATARHIPKAHLDDEYRSLPRVRVDSLADLTDVAAEAGRAVVEDAADGAYLVVDGDVLYSHESTDVAHEADETDEQSAADEQSTADETDEQSTTDDGESVADDATAEER